MQKVVQEKLNEAHPCECGVFKQPQLDCCWEVTQDRDAIEIGTSLRRNTQGWDKATQSQWELR